MEITTNDLCFAYKGGTDVLHHINLELSGNGLYCIIGPNGVGKSTLVKCMNRLLTPTGGSVTVNGKDISDYTNKELALFMGYVPVSSQDCFSMPVVDTVLMGRYSKSKWRVTDQDLAKTYSTLKLLQIDDLAMRGFNELSAGQHQKVALARGLVGEPDILILDEPTSNLDVRHQVYVTELLYELSKQHNMMVVMISHDLNIAAKYADEIIMMQSPGIIYDVGSPSEVITEDSVSDVYGVECEVIHRRGRPHVIL